ncbi:hypothetical protein JB92DRAFT_3124569 [Gautieria morchelliformis]|nr:hypothetical protein JB92DRAFT_3124569 [Gautieria morchelliformis]
MMYQTSLTGSDPGLGIGSADVNYMGEYALGGQPEELHCLLPGCDNTWHCGPSPRQNGASVPSVGLDCYLVFKQQGLHYTAPDPSSSLISSACDRMSSSAEGELRSRSGYDTLFRLSPGLTSLQYIDDGQETGSYFLPPVGNAPCLHNGLDPGGTPFSDDSPDNLVHTDGGHHVPTIHQGQFDYNRGMVWTTTATPPAANLASGQLAGASTRRPDAAPSPTPQYESPSSSDSEDDDLAPTTSETPHPTECGHTDANGRTCRKVDVDHTLHWIADHVMRELKHIQRGSLAISRATILKSDADVLRAEALQVVCPYGCTTYRKRRRTFSQEAHLLRHFRETCRKNLTDRKARAVAAKEWQSKRGLDVLTKNSGRKSAA